MLMRKEMEGWIYIVVLLHCMGMGYTCHNTGRILPHFNCSDGTDFLFFYEFCNDIRDCSDGEDEITYDSAVHSESDGIPCRSHIYPDKVCFLNDSRTGSKKFLCNNGGGCDSLTFRCADNSTCIAEDFFCDGTSHCRDSSDEIPYRKSQQGVRCPGPEQDCLLPNKYVCDGRSHCSDGSDECFCESDGTLLFSDKVCFRCLGNTSKIISSAQLCDGSVDCPDLSDECLCADKANMGLELCTLVEWGGNGDVGTLPCNVNEPNGKKFNVSDMCNARSICGSSTGSYHAAFCESARETPDEHKEEWEPCDECWSRCLKGPATVECDGIPTCEDYEDECQHCKWAFCEYIRLPGPSDHIRAFVCGDGSKALKRTQICDGVEDCSRAEDEFDCPGKPGAKRRFSSQCIIYVDKYRHRFNCISRLPVNIPNDKICDLRKDCYDESDEATCVNNTHAFCQNETDPCDLTHFYCEDGTFLDRRKQVCNGNVDCKTATDECQNCTRGVFSNDEQLISVQELLPFLWIISVTAVFGNFAVLVRNAFVLLRGFREQNLVAKSNRILILNLALADLLVGVYTLSMCVLNRTLSEGGYCKADHAWRGGTHCSLMGVLLVVGSQESVFLLCVMTAVRLYTINRPFQRISIRVVCILLAFSWIANVIVAVIPLLPWTREYFVESIWYSDNAFVTKVDREQMGEMAKRMVAMQRLDDTFVAKRGPIGSWRLLETLIADLNPKYTPARRFGYYSSHGVCLPRFFPDKENDASWGYSVFIISLNFLAFFLIFVGYFVIYRFANKATMATRSGVDRLARLQRKAARIIFTDFCCWMPICIMAFIQLYGNDIPKEYYIPVGMILVPINSALNPILYSDILEWIGNLKKWLESKVEYSSVRRGSAGTSQSEGVEMEMRSAALQTNSS